MAKNTKAPAKPVNSDTVVAEKTADVSDFQDMELEDLLDVDGNAPSVLIISRVDGFRRAGMAHSKEEVFHEAGTFTGDQLKQLLNEPTLIVNVAQ